MGKHKKDKFVKKENSDNDSDKETQNNAEKNKKNQDNTQELKNESTSKPRGRPRKILPTINNSIQKQKFADSDNDIEKSPIALHIPLYEEDSSEVSEKNEFTMKDEESEEEKIKKEKNLIMYLTDDDSDDEYNVKNLKKKLKKRDELIKKLKSDAKSDFYNENSYSVNKKKDPNINLLKLKLYNKDGICSIGEKTKISCWWCTFTFDDLPCFIPEKYNSGKYFVFGCFCSYNCALAYILKDDEYKIANRVSLIKRMYSEIYETENPLYPSPPRELLSKFGGPMTIDEYRSSNQTHELKEYKMKFANIIPTPVFFEETKKEYNAMLDK